MTNAAARPGSVKIPTSRDVRDAARRLPQALRGTPCLEASWLSRPGHGRVWLKLETLQPTHSFKVRGACNAVLALLDEARRAAGTRDGVCGQPRRRPGLGGRPPSRPVDGVHSARGARDQAREHRRSRGHAPRGGRGLRRGGDVGARVRQPARRALRVALQRPARHRWGRDDRARDRGPGADGRGGRRSGRRRWPACGDRARDARRGPQMSSDGCGGRRLAGVHHGARGGSHHEVRRAPHAGRWPGRQPRARQHHVRSRAGPRRSRRHRGRGASAARHPALAGARARGQRGGGSDRPRRS